MRRGNHPHPSPLPSECEGVGRLPAPFNWFPAHPPCFIDISAMLHCNMADISLARGEGVGARGEL